MFKNGDTVLLEDGFFSKRVKLVCLGDTVSCVTTIALKVNEVKLVATSKLKELKEVPVKNETTRHPQAELMLLYANDAMETDKPWERWEHLHKNDIGKYPWTSVTRNPTWESCLLYRRKPKTIKIGNYDVPEPLRVAPEDGTYIYVVDLTHIEGWVQLPYGENTHGHRRLLAKGLLHFDRQAADLHAKALLSFTTTEIKND